LISMHAHFLMGPEVVVGGVPAKLAEDVYRDENGMTLMLQSLNRLREEVLSRLGLRVEEDHVQAIPKCPFPNTPLGNFARRANARL